MSHPTTGSHEHSLGEAGLPRLVSKSCWRGLAASSCHTPPHWRIHAQCWSVPHIWENSSIPYSWTSGNSAGLIQPPAIWLSKDAPILNGSNWVLIILCFLISRRCVTRAWQFSSASTETFGNSAISYLKSENKKYIQTQSPNCHSWAPAHWPRACVTFFLIILTLVPEPLDRDKHVLNWDEFMPILYWHWHVSVSSTIIKMQICKLRHPCFVFWFNGVNEVRFFCFVLWTKFPQKTFGTLYSGLQWPYIDTFFSVCLPFLFSFMLYLLAQS